MSVRNRALARAGKLLDLAEHGGTPTAEAYSARRLARVLMLRHGLRDADVLPYRHVAVQHAAAPRPVVIYAPRTWVENWGLNVRITVLGEDPSQLYRSSIS